MGIRTAKAGITTRETQINPILVPANLKVTLHSNFVVSQYVVTHKKFLLTYDQYAASKFLVRA